MAPAIAIPWIIVRLPHGLQPRHSLFHKTKILPSLESMSKWNPTHPLSGGGNDYNVHVYLKDFIEWIASVQYTRCTPHVTVFCLFMQPFSVSTTLPVPPHHHHPPPHTLGTNQIFEIHVFPQDWQITTQFGRRVDMSAFSIPGYKI